MVIIRNSLPQPIAGSYNSTDAVYYTKDMTLVEHLTYQSIEIPKPNRWRIPKGCFYVTQIHNGETYLYTVLRNDNTHQYYFISLSGYFTVSYQNNVHQDTHQFAMLEGRIFLFVNPNTSTHTLYEWDKGNNQWKERYRQFGPSNYHCFGFMDQVLCIISTTTHFENLQTDYYSSYFFDPDMNPTQKVLKQSIPKSAIRVSPRVFMRIGIGETDQMSVYLLEGDNKDDLDLKLVTHHFYTRYNVASSTHTTMRQNQIMCFGYSYSSEYDYLIVNDGYGGYRCIDGKGSTFLNYRKSLFSIYLNPKEILCYSSNGESYDLWKMNPSGEEVVFEKIQTITINDNALYPLPGLPIVCYDPNPENVNGNLTLYMGALNSFPMLETPGTVISSKTVTDDGEITYPESGNRLAVQPSNKDFKGHVFVQKGDKGYSF